MFRKYFLLILFLFLLPALQIHGKILQIEDFNQCIPNKNQTTYLDLLRFVFPDLKKDGIANKTVPIRDISNTNQALPYQGKMQVNGIDAIFIKNDEKLFLLLLINVIPKSSIIFPWYELHTLALYQMAPKPLLLDAMDVKFDQFTSFWSKTPEIKYHPNKTAVIINNHHFNAGESYTALTLIGIQKDKLKILFNEFPTLYYGRSNRREIDESASITVKPTSSKSYFNIDFNLRLVKKSYEEDAETLKEQQIKTFCLTITWQNGAYHYLDEKTELEKLEYEEEQFEFGDVENKN